MSRVKITGPAWLLKNKLPDGTANPFRDELDYLVRRAANKDSKIQVTETSTTAIVDGIQDIGQLPLASVLGLVAGGCTVEGWPSWVKLLPAQLEDDVPNYLQNATIQPEEGDERLKTWDEWGMFRRVVTEPAEIWVETSSGGAWATGAVLAQLNTAGYTIKSTPELLAYLIENETPVEP